MGEYSIGLLDIKSQGFSYRQRKGFCKLERDGHLEEEKLESSSSSLAEATIIKPTRDDRQLTASRWAISIVSPTSLPSILRHNDVLSAVIRQRCMLGIRILTRSTRGIKSFLSYVQQRSTLEESFDVIRGDIVSWLYGQE